MAQDNQIVDEPVVEPEVNPVTNTVVVPFTEVPASVTPEETVETVETPVEPEVPFVDPFATEVPPVTDTGMSARDREELERFRSQESSLTKREADVALASEARAIQAQYVARGYDEQSAQQIAQDIAQERITARTDAQSQIDEARAEQRGIEAKQNYIAELQEKYPGIDRNALMRFNDKSSMGAFAEERWARIQDRLATDKRFAALEGAQVEDGVFDSANSASSTPLTPAQLIAKAGADPSFQMTPEQHKQVSTHLGLDT